jgi:hypothetical protein
LSSAGKLRSKAWDINELSINGLYLIDMCRLDWLGYVVHGLDELCIYMGWCLPCSLVRLLVLVDDPARAQLDITYPPLRRWVKGLGTH